MAFLIPLAALSVIGAIAVLLLNIPAAEAAMGFARICLWLAATVAVGAALWPPIVAVLLYGGAELRESSCVAALALAFCPLLSFIVAGDLVFSFLGVASLLFWMMMFFHVCVVCQITPMAWRLFSQSSATAGAQ